ncbi:hypothetical protein [Bradyrhizobium sp. Gha]|uniref:hypothetical protein n=1 Tax=Bradyrhizobium sp. Gha TaxID=1855318 RepID=UPI0008F01A92|nr:hypothetical protein [Bradyrhizobium sp. Gha]SFI62060.1 hypothetical protein SAMN05216525_11173 [Bradyrhizobium sp. Gha]
MGRRVSWIVSRDNAQERPQSVRAAARNQSGGRLRLTNARTTRYQPGTATCPNWRLDPRLDAVAEDESDVMLIAVSPKPLRHGDSIDRVCQHFHEKLIPRIIIGSSYSRRLPT